MKAKDELRPVGAPSAEDVMEAAVSLEMRSTLRRISPGVRQELYNLLIATHVSVMGLTMGESTIDA